MTYALDALIEAVEAGTLATTDLVEFTNTNHALAFSAYHGSLDAALALHHALLPGWIFDVTNDSAFVLRHDEFGQDEPLQYQADGPHARAWLLAILRAYREVRK
jgi:hypothetical protein